MNNKKSLTHVWSVACSNSLLDKESNNISLLNTLEKWTISVNESELEKVKKNGAEGIVFPISFEVVSRFTRKEVGAGEAFDYKLNLINPGGKSIVNSLQKLAIDKNIKNIRVRTNIQSLPISISGDYIITVEFKDVSEAKFDKVAEVPIEVVINPVPDKK